MDTTKEESIGVIPVHKNDSGGLLFLLVLHKEGHWSFPKGHKDEGENDIETAKRELYEETGIRESDIDTKKIFIQEYTYKRDGKLYYKEVKYFLGFTEEIETQTLEEFKSEIRDIKWLSFSNALETMTFEGGKKLLIQVNEYLKSRSIVK